MSASRLDAAEAARIALFHAELVVASSRRQLAAAERLERAASSFAEGLLLGRPPDARDLLPRNGALSEALAASSCSLQGLDDGLDSLHFPFSDEAEPDARLRARALDELRALLERQRAARAAGGARSERADRRDRLDRSTP